jgi:hypothetical protein
VLGIDATSGKVALVIGVGVVGVGVEVVAAVVVLIALDGANDGIVVIGAVGTAVVTMPVGVGTLTYDSESHHFVRPTVSVQAATNVTSNARTVPNTSVRSHI